MTVVAVVLVFVSIVVVVWVCIVLWCVLVQRLEEDWSLETHLFARFRLQRLVWLLWLQLQRGFLSLNIVERKHLSVGDSCCIDVVS